MSSIVQTCRFVILVGITACFAEGLLLNAAHASTDTTSPGFTPRGDQRLIVCHDPAQGWAAANPALNEIAGETLKSPEAWKQAVQDIVRAHADAGVDTIVHNLFIYFATNMAPDVSDITEPIYNLVPQLQPLETMHEAGLDLVNIMLDQSHTEGMTFIAGFRMNDRHGAAAEARMFVDNPQWHARGVARGLDYAHQEVRDRLVTAIGDVINHYDVDGIELDYMRWLFMFSLGEEAQHAPLLTAMHRRIRKLLDDVGRKRGRHLLFGVRVPDVLEEGALYGFDIATWIQEGNLDYIVPSHFGYMDFNAKIERYRLLTEGTNCRVYPSLNLWAGPCRLGIEEAKESWKPKHYYAAAHNYYAYGADGIATYNYLPISNVSVSTMLRRLNALSPLKDPAQLDARHRDYLFFSRLHGQVHPDSPVGVIRYDVIHLDRSRPDTAHPFGFRVAEDLARGQSTAALEFKAVSIEPEETLELQLNGVAIPADALARLYVWDGIDHKGRPKPYDLFRLSLTDQWLRHGDNVLEIRLAEPVGTKGVVRIEEVNVKVYPH